MLHFQKGVTALGARLSALCPEREIILCSGKQVKSLHISPRKQWAAICVASAALLGLGGTALSIRADADAIALERAQLAQQGKAVASSAGKVAGYRKSVDALARDLAERQDFMDDLYKSHFGNDNVQDAGADLIGSDKTPTKISLAPEAAPLERVASRQRHFALMLTSAVERRADKAASAIRSFGLNPDTMRRSAARAQMRAQGGPFVPWKGSKGAMTDDLQQLAGALSRMELLERSLMAIPSGKPTATPMLSSSYGYRSDPFNGHAAFHAGLDFPGHYGQPILSAAPGKVSYVGQRQGYGNVVEIDHGNGLMTRYAHLSGFASRVGQQVARGDAVGRMGSTGRSTGTHLHFEVRVNGQPTDPRRFLQARQDVLKVQQIAKARVADLDHRG